MKAKNFIVTIILVVINLILYFVPQLFKIPAPLNIVLELGGLTLPGIEQGEYFRLLTAAFLHFSIRHLVNNMLILALMGERVESIMGHARYTVLCFFGAVVPNIISFYYYKGMGQDVLSAGASGLVFALNGAMVAAAVKKIPGALNIGRLIFYTLFSLNAGFSSASTNNIAHLSGLAAGFLIAFILLPNTDEVKEQERREAPGRGFEGPDPWGRD